MTKLLLHLNIQARGMMLMDAETRPIGFRDGGLSGDAAPALSAPTGMPTARAPQACVKAYQK